MQQTTDPQKKAFEDWARAQMQAMADHLGSQKLVEKDQVSVEGRWNYPFRILLGVAWGRKSPNERYWVIAGDVPVDHLESNLAKDAREALKHFALRWQVQAARVKSADRDKPMERDRSKLRIDWTEIGDSLADKAEFLYALADDDRNWESTMRL